MYEITNIPEVRLTTEDMVELGATFATGGLTGEQARGLINDIRQGAENMAIAMTPRLMERVKKIQLERAEALIGQVMLLRNPLGYVRADQVVALIRNIYFTAPKTNG